jgi:branched-chain amino acid transport system substrate-binding protein
VGTTSTKFSIVTLALAIAASLQFTPSPALAQASGSTIKIGALFATSGPGAYQGVQQKEGAELAIEQLNKTGVNGRKFELSQEDSGCAPLTATQAVKRMLDGFKPDVVIGESCSDGTLAVMPLVLQRETPLINASASSLKITDPGNAWTFRIFPHANIQSDNLARNAYEKLDARSAVLLYENTNAGIDTIESFEKAFVAKGGKVLAKIGFGRDVNDFTAIATRIAGLGPVDVIPTASLEGQGAKISQALAQAGITKGGSGKAVQLSNIWLPAGFDEKAGKAAVGFVRIVQFNHLETRAPVKEFLKFYQAKYGADKIPSHLQAQGYDQVMLIADTVRRGATDAKSIRDQLLATKDFEGATGHVVFNGERQNSSPDTLHYIETLPDLTWKTLDWK